MHSKRDANAYDRYEADAMKQTRLTNYFYENTTRSNIIKAKDLKELALLASSFGSMGEEGLADTMNLTMSIEILQEDESDVKAHLAGSGIIERTWSVLGTVYVLLHHYAGDVDGSVAQICKRRYEQFLTLASSFQLWWKYSA